VCCILGYYAAYSSSGVPRGVISPRPKFRSFDKAELNSQFYGKYIVNNRIRICVSLICKLSGSLTRGLLPPDPHSLCLLSSAEFVEPPQTKFLGMPLYSGSLCNWLVHLQDKVLSSRVIRHFSLKQIRV
jgi:hypothetical protein